MADTIAISSATDAAVSGSYPTQAARAVVVGSGAASGTPATAANPAVQAPAATIDADVSSEIAEYLRASGHEMKFDIDGTTKQVVVKIFNSATGELVRQIPDPELLHLAQALRAGNHTLEASA
jgi:flagellar protein FlaG